MRIAIIALALGAVAGAAAAQNAPVLRVPAPSPAASVSRVIGATKVTVDYSSPGVKGRNIWGELVPYGEVWRTGANTSTDIEFGDEVKVGGATLPAGRYALFTIPQKDEWTVIISKRPKQGGAFEYKESEDAVRFKAKPHAHENTEWLNFDLTPKSRDTLTVNMSWEKIMLSFDVTVDLDGVTEKSLKDALAAAKEGDFAVWMTAARYRLDNNKNLEEAMTWIEKSISIKTTSGNLLLKARIQAKMSKNADALATLAKAADAARAEKNENRLKDIEKLKADLSK